MKCPKCNTDEHLQVNPDMLIMNKGPEGPIHEVMCTKCGVHMVSATIPEKEETCQSLSS